MNDKFMKVFQRAAAAECGDINEGVCVCVCEIEREREAACRWNGPMDGAHVLL